MSLISNKTLNCLGDNRNLLVWFKLLFIIYFTISEISESLTYNIFSDIYEEIGKKFFFILSVKLTDFSRSLYISRSIVVFRLTF